MITLIAAVSDNNALGKNNELLWHLPDDFKRFKEITSHHHIVMGRKTFESLPRLLPNRTHIVISRQMEYLHDGARIVSSLDEALNTVPENQDVFVIGGGEIYSMGMAIADKIELTRVHAHFDADVFFPEINLDYWQLIFQEYHPKDEKHVYDFTFETYLRVS